MKVLKQIEDWQRVRDERSGTLGFVPTMGALHAGHASLLERSVEQNDVTVLSIYVNPTQFNDAADLANYPDTLDEDLALAESIGVDFVILPTYDDLYADDFRFFVDEKSFSLELCGGDRPGHFRGVLTVVMKLLNLVRPDRAYFGEKDYQQYRLVRDMCAAFFLAVEIVPCPTVREADGLAMSSRNKHLDPAARRLAGKLNRAIRSCGSDAEVAAHLTRLGFAVDYVESRGARRYAAASLTSRDEKSGDKVVRLIDNVPLDLTSPVPVIANRVVGESEAAAGGFG